MRLGNYELTPKTLHGFMEEEFTRGTLRLQKDIVNGRKIRLPAGATAAQQEAAPKMNFGDYFQEQFDAYIRATGQNITKDLSDPEIVAGLGWRFEATIKAATMLYVLAEKIHSLLPRYHDECTSRMKEQHTVLSDCEADNTIEDKALDFYDYACKGELAPTLLEWVDVMLKHKRPNTDSTELRAALVSALQEIVPPALRKSVVAVFEDAADLVADATPANEDLSGEASSGEKPNRNPLPVDPVSMQLVA